MIADLAPGSSLAFAPTRPDCISHNRPDRPASAERSPSAESGERRRRVDGVESARVGHRIPGTPFLVIGTLGQGGMGEVLEVEHAELGRRFALKLMHAHYNGRRDLEGRMRQEARALAAIRHPNLVEVFDLGAVDDGRLYFVMEALRGHDLRRELRRFGVLAVPAALRLIAQALDGLDAAHNAGVVHRDIKLENLFLCADGSLKVLDFGVAKVRRPGAELTSPGQPAGTVRCMAPEQHLSGDVDERTDIYAAGLALYELITGRGPFDELRGNTQALRYAHCDREPPRPSELASQRVPPAVEEVILRALAKRPDDRFQTAADMAAAIRSLLVASPAQAGAQEADPTRRAEPAFRHPTSFEKTRPFGWGAHPAIAALSTLVVVASTLGSALAEILPRRI